MTTHKILVLSPFLWTHQEGGGVPTVFNTVHNWTHWGEVHLVIPSRDDAPPVYRNIHVHPFHLWGWGQKSDYGLFRSVFLYPVPRPRWLGYVVGKWLWLQISLTCWWQARKLAQKIKPNLFYGVSSYTLIPLLLLRLEFSGPQILRLLGTFLTPLTQMKTGSFFKRWMFLLPRFNEYLCFKFPFSSLIITNDGTQGDKVAEILGSPSPVSFWRNGLDLPETEQLKNRPTIRQEVRAQQKTSEDAVVGVYAGQLIPWKKVERAVKAYSLLPESYQKRLRIWIIGSGPEKEKLMSMRAQLPVPENVQMLGSLSQNDLWKHYMASDFFICPHDLSCAANATFEAMAFELPIVCTCYGDTKDFVSHEKQGLYFDGLDTETLVVNMKRMVDQPELRRQLGQEARAKVKTEFASWKDRSQKEWNLFEKLVAEESV